MSPAENWYAIRVKANRERVTSLALEAKGLEVCLPTYHDMRVRERGLKTTRVPLFPGYVFSRFDLRNRLPVVSVPGVVNIVGFGNRAHPVDSGEMDAVLALSCSKIEVKPHVYLPVGRRVRVLAGPLRGVEGVVISHESSHKLVVSVTLLQRSIAVEVDRSWLVPLASAKYSAA